MISYYVDYFLHDKYVNKILKKKNLLLLNI